MWLYIFRAFCVARARYTRLWRVRGCAALDETDVHGRKDSCRYAGGWGHVLTARRATVDKVDPVALILESCIYFTEAQNKSNLTNRNFKGMDIFSSYTNFEILRLKLMELEIYRGLQTKWQPPSVQFMWGLVSQGCEVRRFRNMEIQMNGARNVEVLKQRSNRTANHRVTSICDDLSCR